MRGYGMGGEGGWCGSAAGLSCRRRRAPALCWPTRDADIVRARCVRPPAQNATTELLHAANSHRKHLLWVLSSVAACRSDQNPGFQLSKAALFPTAKPVVPPANHSTHRCLAPAAVRGSAPRLRRRPAAARRTAAAVCGVGRWPPSVYSSGVMASLATMNTPTSAPSCSFSEAPAASRCSIELISSSMFARARAGSSIVTRISVRSWERAEGRGALLARNI